MHVPSNPVPVTPDRDKEIREQKLLPDTRGEVEAPPAPASYHPGGLSSKAVGKRWSQNHDYKQGGSQEGTTLNSDSGIISNICTESDHFHILQAVRVAGLKFRAEMGQKAETRTVRRSSPRP